MRNIIFISIIIVTQSCNQEGIGCFTPAGETVIQENSIGAFIELDVSGNIDVELRTGNDDIIAIQAGSNELEGISAVIKDSVLYLSNNNSCNWTRRYENPVVSINYQSLQKIILRGYGTITSNEVIELPSLSLASIQGSGDFKLNLNVESLSVSSNDVANFYMQGRASSLNLGHYFNEGIFYGEELRTVNCRVTHRGTNTMHLNVSGSLNGKIESFGDVMLYGQEPQSIDVEETNSGTIIRQF